MSFGDSLVFPPSTIAGDYAVTVQAPMRLYAKAASTARPDVGQAPPTAPVFDDEVHQGEWFSVVVQGILGGLPEVLAVQGEAVGAEPDDTSDASGGELRLTVRPGPTGRALRDWFDGGGLRPSSTRHIRDVAVFLHGDNARAPTRRVHFRRCKPVSFEQRVGQGSQGRQGVVLTLQADAIETR